MFQKIYLLILITLILPLAAYSAINNGTVDVNNSIAWGGNLGWINFAPQNGGIYNGLKITDSEVSGYAWSKQYGWINFSPSNGGVTNNCSGYLGGYAWSSQLGWLSLTGAAINNEGRIIGIAGLNNDKAGRINFNCSNCLVKTDWRPCAARSPVITNSGSGASGGSVSPSSNLLTTATSTNPIVIEKIATSTPLVEKDDSSWYLTTVKRSDIFRDGIVDLLDFNSLMVNWGRKNLENRADTNLDGIVDLLDFNSLMVNWGKIEK